MGRVGVDAAGGAAVAARAATVRSDRGSGARGIGGAPSTAGTGGRYRRVAANAPALSTRNRVSVVSHPSR
jgi:hypothetical protein